MSRLSRPSLPLWAIGLFLHAGCWFAMLGSHRSWIGSWKAGLDWAVGSVVIVGPLVAGIAAATYSSRRRTSVLDLAVASAHPVRGWYDPALRLWGVSVLSLGALVVEVTVMARVLGVPAYPGQLVIVPLAVVMLAVHVLIGVVVGLRAPALIAAPLAGVVSFALFLLATQGRAPRSFITGGVTGSLAGGQYRPTAVLALLGIALAVGAAVAATSGWWSLGSKLAAVTVVVGLGASMALTISTRTDSEERFEFATVHLRCQGQGPQVCVAEETPRILGSAARRMHALAEPLRSIGVPLPQRWVELLSTEHPDPSVGWIDFVNSSDAGTRADDRDVVGALAMPAGCPQYGAGETQLSMEVRQLLSRWIAYRNGFGDVAHAKPWFSSPASETWVRRTYELQRECRLDDLRMP